MNIVDKRKKCTTYVVDLAPGDLFYFVGGRFQSLFMKIERTDLDLRRHQGYVSLIGGTYYTAKNNPNTYAGTPVIKVEEAELKIIR